MTPTRDALGIFWCGEERPGVIAYGLWSPPSDALPSFPVGAWPHGAASKETRLAGPWADEPWEAAEAWSILAWDIYVPRWPSPDRWRATLEATLRALVNGGARLGWFGIDGTFVEPPTLFDPDRMAGSVWGTLLPGGDLQCHADLDGPFTPLTPDELKRLRPLVPR